MDVTELQNLMAEYGKVNSIMEEQKTGQEYAMKQKWRLKEQ